MAVLLLAREADILLEVEVEDVNKADIQINGQINPRVEEILDANLEGLIKLRGEDPIQVAVEVEVEVAINKEVRIFTRSSSAPVLVTTKELIFVGKSRAERTGSRPNRCENRETLPRKVIIPYKVQG